ncbi:MAG: hypothetical protein JKY61_03420 [Planctomycetes bacterium]|nr:hypothetical protein [Planctomycetota bacterium]
MPKWILLIVLATLALGSAFYFTQSGGASGLETLENGDLQPEMVRTTDAPAAHLRGIGGEAEGPQNNRTSGPTRTGRASLSPNIQVATAGGEFHVLLLEPQSRRPVEGMHVYLLDRDVLAADEWRLAGANMRDLRTLIKGKGIEQVSDANGMAFFDRVLDGAIWAEGAGWQGFFDWIGPPESPLILKLSPHSELEVLVLDDEGHEMRGVPLAVLSKKPGQWVGLLKRTTLASGIAQFPGVSAFVNRSSKNIPLAIGFHFPHAPRVWHEIDPEWLPEDPIEMRIPPYAPLTIKVVGADGAPFEGRFTVEVGMANDEPGKRVTSILTKHGTQGEVTFPFVGAGASLRIQLSGSSEIKNLIVDLRGPAQGEKDAVREIAWFERRLKVNGAVRGPRGPLVNRRMQVSWGDGRDRRSLPIQTDAKGNFSVTLSGAAGAHLHLRAAAQGNDGPCEGSVNLPQPAPQGEWDSGLTILKGQTMFAEGRVLNSMGSPIQGARVQLETWRKGRRPGSGKNGGSGKGGKSGGGKDDAAKDGPGKGAGVGKKEEESKGEGYWSPVGRVFAITDEDGRFQLFGRAYTRRLRLTASHREYLTESVKDVVQGMPPVYFTLRPGNQPAGSRNVLSTER